MRRDEALILDIVEAARRIRHYAANLTRQTLEEDELRQDAIIRVLQVIGEATKMLSIEFKTAHPVIPWKEIAGMRDRIVHKYFEVDLNIVWEVINNDIGVLLATLEPLIPPENDD